MKRYFQPTGFSMLELVIYIGLFSVFMVAILTIGSRSLSSKTKAFTIQEVEHNARFALQRVTIDARNATDVNETDFAAGVLTLTMPNSDTVQYTVTAAQLTRQVNSDPAVTLTSDEVSTNMTLEDRTAFGTEVWDMNVTIDVSAASAVNPSPQYSADASLTSAISVRQ